MSAMSATFALSNVIYIYREGDAANALLLFKDDLNLAHRLLFCVSECVAVCLLFIGVCL